MAFTEHADCLRSQDSYGPVIPAARRNQRQFRRASLRPRLYGSGVTLPPNSSQRRGSTKRCRRLIYDEYGNEHGADKDEDEPGDDDDHDNEGQDEDHDNDNSDTGGSQPGAESSSHAAASAADDTDLSVNIKEASREIDVHKPREQIVRPLSKT